MRRKLSVRDWPESEQPAVRAREKGIEALSDAELLSLVLKKCTYEQTEVGVSLDLLRKAGGLRQLFDFLELPESQKVTLQAVREIGRRVLKQGDGRAELRPESPGGDRLPHGEPAGP